jgi:PAS domain S-box-containing protein
MSSVENQLEARTEDPGQDHAWIRTLLEVTPIGIALMDLSGRILVHNREMGRLLEASRSHRSGEALLQLCGLDSTDVSAWEASPTRALPPAHRLETSYLTEDGRRAWVRISIRPVRRNEQAPKTLVVMAEDVTEEKQAQTLAIQNDKLSVLGRLAASLTHEINNPLQSVVGSLDLAREMLDDGDDPSQYLAVAQDELRRVARIVAGLRDLTGQPDTLERAPVDLAEVLESVCMLTTAQAERQGVTLHCDRVLGLRQVAGVADRLRQVFLNLYLNALEAMPDGGHLRVNAQSTREPPGVIVTVADTGHGIPSEQMSQLFMPFFTTKPNGMGMGLYNCRQIVERHGGKIEVFSTESQGSRVVVWLPAL